MVESPTVAVRAKRLDDVEPLSPGDAEPLRVLLLADMSHPARVVRDYISAIVDLSQHEVVTFNPCGWTDGALPDTTDVDVLVIHYSIYILGRHFLPGPVEALVYDFSGPKVQIIQDEYRDISEMKAKMRRLGISVVISSLSVENIERVYDSLDADVYAALPGAVPTDLLDRAVPDIVDRDLDVVYRAYSLPFVLGRHAQLKPWLVTVGRELEARYDLRVDVSDRDADRIYGEAWPDFITSSRTTLGCEGGASVFDFGGVAQATAAYLEDHPDATFDEVHHAVLARVDGEIVHRTVTPRVFETVALRTAMVLVRGEYRGLLRPWDHYVPLAPDGSNLDEVAAAIRDPALLQRMTAAVYEDVGRSPATSWPHMIARIDAVLVEAVERGERSRPTRRARALLLRDRRAGTSATGDQYGSAIESFSSMLVDSRAVGVSLPEDVVLDDYDVVALHAMTAERLGGWISDELRRRLRGSSAIKVAVLPEVRRWTRGGIATLTDLGVTVAFCRASGDELAELSQVGRDVIDVRTIEREHVRPALVHSAAPPYSERDVGVGYWGRDLPFWPQGSPQRLTSLGRRFADAAAEAGLVIDLAWGDWGSLPERDRSRFLARTKAILEVADVARHEPGARTGRSPVPTGQITAQMLDAAALRTLIVVYGSFSSDHVRPWVHYVPLDEDLGNLREVLRMIDDDEAAREIIRNAHDDLVLDPSRSIVAFADHVDEVVLDAVLSEERSVGEEGGHRNHTPFTPIVVAPRFSDDIAGDVQAIVGELRSGPVWFAAPRGTDEHPAGFEVLEVDINRPAEDQAVVREVLASMQRPVFIATHLTVETFTISRTVPTIWFETGSDPRPVGRAIALADRAAVVIAPAALGERMAIGSKLLPAGACDATDVRRLLDEWTGSRPDLAYHRAITAELFGRSATAIQQAGEARGASAYLTRRLRSRLDVLDEDVETERDSDDATGRFAALLTGAEDGGVSPIPGRGNPLLRSMYDLQRASSLDELEALQVITDSEGVPQLRRAAALFVLDLVAEQGGTLSETMRRLLAFPDVAAVIRPDHLVALAATTALEDGLLELVLGRGRPLSVAAAKIIVESRRAERGERPDIEVLDELAGALSAQVRHLPLWTSGLDYWRRLTGEAWRGPTRPVSDPPVTHWRSPTVPPIEDVDRRAREALAGGSLDEALELFERVRSMCSASHDDRWTTELAARLNAGWVRATLGHDRDDWVPYIESVLVASGPPADLYEVMALHATLSARARSDDLLEFRLTEFERLVSGAATGDGATAAELDEVIATIDRAATHPSLWATSLDYWEQMAGQPWRPTEDRQPVPPPSPKRSPGTRLSPEQISKLDRKGRWALRARMHRWAIEYFGRVRVACDSADAVLTTTELAARLNEGLARSRAGRDREEWAPLVASVIEEAGPPERAVKVRVEAARLREGTT